MNSESQTAPTPEGGPATVGTVSGDAAVSAEHAALLAQAGEIGWELLAPRAQETDQAPLVPRSNLDALAQAGLLGLAGPREHGGHAAPTAVMRAYTETLAACCGVTYFVQAQHHGPVAMIAGSNNGLLKERYLRHLCRGELMAGVAFSHLRRPGPPAVAARPKGEVFFVTGEAPWVTSWGLASLFVIAATLPDDRILYFLQPVSFAEEGNITGMFRGRPIPTLTAQPRNEGRLNVPRLDKRPLGLTWSDPLRLCAMNASGTVRLRMEEMRVPEKAVLRIVDAKEWRARDAIGTAGATPHTFGVTAACVRLLAERAAKTVSETAARLAEALGDELCRCRSEAYDLAGHSDAPDYVPNALAVRGWSLELAARAAQAAVAACGGAAMSLDHPAQRLAREALFYTIQAQTTAVRDATLRRLERA